MLLTYTCSNLPAWALLSASGVITVLPTAPPGDTALNLSVTDGLNVWTRSVTVRVLPRNQTEQWFTVNVSSPKRIALSLSVRSEPAPAPARIAYRLLASASAEQRRPSSLALSLSAVSDTSDGGGGS